jgi:hypothetical protein
MDKLEGMANVEPVRLDKKSEFFQGCYSELMCHTLCDITHEAARKIMATVKNFVSKY